MAAEDVVSSATPPPGWAEKCGERADLFHTAAWQALLREGFGCASVYLWDARLESGCALPIFSFGPLRIGYLGFPAGGCIGSLSAPASLAAAVTNLSYGRRVDAIRVPISGFSPPLLARNRAVSAPETAIVDLAHWNTDALSSALRRNLKKFNRSDLELRRCDDVDLGAEGFHRLYLGTIERHRGRRRYGRAYFRALIALSLSSNRLRCIGAYEGSELAGFLVAASSGGTVFYLHGASDRRFSAARPSDALFLDAIMWAKEIGADQFNMMSSPPSQPGLVRFKEKWGGTTRRHRTCTLPLSWMGRLAAPLLSRGSKKPLTSAAAGG